MGTVYNCKCKNCAREFELLVGLAFAGIFKAYQCNQCSAFCSECEDHYKMKVIYCLKCTSKNLEEIKNNENLKCPSCKNATLDLIYDGEFD